LPGLPYFVDKSEKSRYIIFMRQAEKVNKEKKEPGDYDSAWKEIIQELWEPFIAMFYPQIHRDIDFSRKPRFLNNELKKIDPANRMGKRIADALLQVYLKDGSRKIIFIHIEIQSTRDSRFKVRMYTYNYRIFDHFWRKNLEVISLAVLTDQDAHYRPEEYKVGRWGFELKMKIPIVKIIDYKNRPELKEKVENSDNPMAMVIRAQLKSYEAKKRRGKGRYDIKSELFKECLKAKYPSKQIRALMRFIDWLIRLPEGLEKKLFQEISKLEEGHKMAYVTTWERMGIKKGVEIGVEKGVEKEKKKTREMLKKLLQNGVSPDLLKDSSGLSMGEIKKLMPSEN